MLVLSLFGSRQLSPHACEHAPELHVISFGVGAAAAPDDKDLVAPSLVSSQLFQRPMRILVVDVNGIHIIIVALDALKDRGDEKGAERNPCSVNRF